LLPEKKNMKSTVTNGEYRNIPIATLTESPTNPRKRFDEKALEELAATFKTQGVLEPLLVRELEERAYQVVIGARRLRAAKIAELEAVPVRVVKLSDAEAILGGKVFQVTKPRFVQWTISVTCDGAWTAIQSSEHEKPPGREGSAPTPSFVQSELGLFCFATMTGPETYRDGVLSSIAVLDNNLLHASKRGQPTDDIWPSGSELSSPLVDFAPS
jgi:ParB-like nuclease domain